MKQELVIDALTKGDVVNRVAEIVRDVYVFHEIGEKMADFIIEQQAKGEYDNLNEIKPFCSKLTADLRTICNDKHIFVFYSPEEAHEVRADKGLLSAEEIALQKAAYKLWYERQNNGFQKVEILPGNIGYLKLNIFPHVHGAETCAHAMGFLAHANAIIIDLRDNGGGEGLGDFLSSYFFTPERVLLGGARFRDSSQNSESYTLPFVPGKRLPDIDLYILLSSRSFSAAEAFAYDLQQLKRAVIVGENSKGGAHPIDVLIVKGDILTQVPIGSSYNPISKTNWEGMGVTPDIKTTEEAALNTAHITALENVIKKTTDKDYKQELQKILESIIQ
ncbi:MAG: S41 family peptidase [Candidatus Cloacimonetes bacterium]|nr:S41 family peptidase [Candidatus Cloacimonadota bacterium]